MGVRLVEKKRISTDYFLFTIQDIILVLRVEKKGQNLVFLETMAGVIPGDPLRPNEQRNCLGGPLGFLVSNVWC